MDVVVEDGVGADVVEAEVVVVGGGDAGDEGAGEGGDAAGFVVEDVRGGGGEDGVGGGGEVCAEGEDVALDR